MGIGEREQQQQRRQRRERPPLDTAALNELALAYVSRFATTRAKLRDYLQRKLRERGWAGKEPAGVEALAERLAGLGYIDDSAFALAKSRTLTARGYGVRRVDQALRIAGVSEDDSSQARTLAGEEAAEAALRFARRRRIGPFATEKPDPKAREKALAALVRAGHDFALARALVDAAPGTEINAQELVNQS